MTSVLASALGEAAARASGLLKLEVPASLPGRFRHEVANAVRRAGGTAFVVGPDAAAGECSPGEAISYRTAEQDVAMPILLVATEGDARELKSLEAFRDVLEGGLPGSTLRDSGHALVELGGVCDCAARLLALELPSLREKSLASALLETFKFLAEAYRVHGNGILPWTSALWSHLDATLGGIGEVASQLPTGQPGIEVLAVHAAAGLPRPDQPTGYAKPNTPKLFSKVVSDKFAGAEDADRAVARLERTEMTGGSGHPLRALEWSTFPATLEETGHPVLGVCLHGAQKARRTWQEAWSRTSEAAFFGLLEEEDAAFSLEVADSDGCFDQLEHAGWKGVDFVLRRPIPGEGSNRRFELGTYRVAVAFAPCRPDTEGRQTGAAVHVHPSSAGNVELQDARCTARGLEVVMAIHRNVSPGRGWREESFSLEVGPAPGCDVFDGHEPVELKLLAPHPSLPTVLALEERSRGKPAVPVIAQPRLAVDAPATEREIELKSSSGPVTLVVLGAGESLPSSGGRPLEPDEKVMGTTGGAAYALSGVGEEAIVEVDGTGVVLSRAKRSDGVLSPIISAVTGESLLLPDGAQEKALLADPRGFLEEWLAAHHLRGAPSEQARASLGSVLISTDPRRSTGELAWVPGAGVHSDLAMTPVFRFPAQRGDGDVLECFWRAFQDLALPAWTDEARPASWPGSIDLRSVEREQLAHYLEAFDALMRSAPSGTLRAWYAYPFSALLIDPGSGIMKGALLSPLHPLRLAWAWSAQVAGSSLRRSKCYGGSAGEFLRFVNGGELPLVGPDPDNEATWQAIALSNGPDDYFAPWFLLAEAGFSARGGQALQILGRRLPLGAPSGLDQGGVTAALADYRRVYPVATQLRIGLAANGTRERYADTDRAVVGAVTALLEETGDSLPGGVRVLDDKRRRGDRPRPAEMLARSRGRTDGQARTAAFEWTEHDLGTEGSVDVLFLEDSPVTVGAKGVDAGAGTAGPALPFARYKAWSAEDAHAYRSSFVTAPTTGSFHGLPAFSRALSRFESFALDEKVACLRAKLSMGDAFRSDKARWIVTGNRNLDPSVLSMHLKGAGSGLALWEWRPAFLPRGVHQHSSPGLSSSHPYTVIAPVSELEKTVTARLSALGIEHAEQQSAEVISVLGARGIGLSSLLTIGGTHAMGAIGFWLSYRVLEGWEASGPADGVRCILPIDTIYPLLEVLGAGSSLSDHRRRADLLLLDAHVADADKARLTFHPVEVKARSGASGSFPASGGAGLADALEQLEATSKLLEAVAMCHREDGRDQPLACAALATLLETALAIRPHGTRESEDIEATLLELVARGCVELEATRGTVTWFQAGGHGTGGAGHEPRHGHPGILLCRMDATCDDSQVGQQREDARRLVDSALGTMAATGRVDRSPPAPAEGPAGGEHPASGSAPAVGAAPQEVDAILEESRSEAKPGKARVEARPGIEVLVGHEPLGTGKPRPVVFKPSETALNSLNIGVVGDLGTGKTQFLQSLTFQLARSAPSNRGVAPRIFVFDYKMDYSEGKFPAELGAQVLDPTEEPLPINYFALPADAKPRDRVSRANFFRDLLVRVCNIGKVQGHAIYSCVMGAYKDCATGYHPTMRDIRERYEEWNGGKGDSVLSILALLDDLAVFEPDGSRTRAFTELFDRTTVLNLGRLSASGQEVTDVVATIFIDFLYSDYMKKLRKPPFVLGDDGVQRRCVNSFVLIDEAHHAMSRGFDVLMKMMLEGREFGLGVILSSQYLSHFRLGDKNWSEPLATWMVHRVNSATAKDFASIGFGASAKSMAETVQSLDVHWGYFRCANGYDDGLLIKGQPFFSLDRG